MNTSKLAVFLLLIICVSAEAQIRRVGDILVVQSWKDGTDKIADQTVKFVLTQKTRSIQRDIKGSSGKVYRLGVVPAYYSDLKGEHWKVELREVLRNIGGTKKLLSEDLLYVSKPGKEWRHEFPLEDMAAFFYPDETSGFLVNGERWAEGSTLFYPLKMVRKIKVAGFVVTLTVGELTFTPNDPKHIKKFEIIVNFANASPAAR
jgi:hypothetical protein